MVKKIIKEAEEMGIRLRQGIYVMNTGPSYETPAEIRMMRLLGGGAVGMSSRSGFGNMGKACGRLCERPQALC